MDSPLLRLAYRMGEQVLLEIGLIALSDGDIRVAVHDDAGTLYLLDTVHIDYIRAVYLKELPGQALPDGRERAECDQRLLLAREEYLQVLAISLDVPYLIGNDAHIPVVGLDKQRAA